MILRIPIFWLSLLVFLAFGAGAGVAGDTNRLEAQPAVVTAADGADSARVLSANDVITVTVFGEDDLTVRSTIIDKSGMVMLPLLGQVKLSGLTVQQATGQIQKLYDKDYVINPQVNLVVERFAERRFAVLGQVNKPDSYGIPQNETVNLVVAIAMAGGYTRLGDPSSVTVRRVEFGADKIYHLDAKKMARDQKEKQFEILPGDIITVGEKVF